MTKKSAAKNSNAKATASFQKKTVPIIPVAESSEEEEVVSADDEDDGDDNAENDDGDDSDDVDGEDEEEVTTDDSDDGFEQQSSSDDDADDDDKEEEVEVESDSDIEAESKIQAAESSTRNWSEVGKQRTKVLDAAKADGTLAVQQYLHTDDLSSDDEEYTGNTIGRVPLHWYDAHDHIGYNISGEKIAKRKDKDRIDTLLSNHDDPESRRTVYDMYNDREVVLSERDLEIIRRIQAGAFAHPEHNDTPDYVDYYSSIKEVMPISAMPEPKRRFLPSKWELMRVMKIVKAIEEGRYVDIATRRKEKMMNKDERKPIYMIWDDKEDEILAESKRYQYHLPAPKMTLPGHAESYNPPSEYLLTDEEVKQIEDMDPAERPMDFIPKKFTCLRHVSGYKNFVKERFERCLDLYLCPRKLKKRLNIDPEALVPRLPKPRDLKPFPNSLCLQFIGHKKAVRTISVSPDGQHLASGSDDGVVKLWEVATSFCKFSWDLKNGPIVQVAWNPMASHHVLAAVAGNKTFFIATGTGDADATEVTDSLFASVAEQASKTLSPQDGLEDSEGEDHEQQSQNSDDEEGEEEEGGATSIGNKAKFSIKWSDVSSVSWGDAKNKFGSRVGPRFSLECRGDIKSIHWHHKGDYIVTLSPTLGTKAVAIHQISKAKSQCPFNKSPGRIQTVCFHPARPFLFVVTQQHVKIYHLVEQRLMKRLLSGCKWLSSIDIHPSGDHIIVGSYDRRVVWFDLDLSSSPYKTLKFHEKAVRGVNFHRRYPLMASAADDGTVHVFHAMTYSDLTRNALIVPLKVLRGHGVKGDLGVMDIKFHPKQPWIFSSGSDGLINLYQDI